MTGYGLDEDFESSKFEGFDRHLVKPIDFGVLETVLNELSTTRKSPISR